MISNIFENFINKGHEEISVITPVVESCHDNSNTWINTWQQISCDLVTLTHNLGITVAYNKSSSTQQSSVSFLVKNKSLTGSNKCKIYERSYEFLIKMLTELIHTGCGCGAVSLDLSALVPLFSAIFNTTITTTVGGSNTKDTIQNKFGVSLNDLSDILPQLKIQCLILLNLVLSTHHLSVMRMATALVDPFISLLSQEHSWNIPVLRQQLYITSMTLMQVMPTIFISTISPTVLTPLLDKFHTTILELTKSHKTVLSGATTTDILTYKSSISQSKKVSGVINTSNTSTVKSGGLGGVSVLDMGKNNTNSKQNNHKNNSRNKSKHLQESISDPSIDSPSYESKLYDTEYIQDILTLFQVIEYILLYINMYLEPKQREYIEYCISIGLNCLTKGILPYQPLHRHLRRSPCEFIRLSPILQNGFLSLANIEIMIPTTENMMSGNITLLKLVCEACLIQHTTSYQAVKTLSLIDTILYPSRIPLPSNHTILRHQQLSTYYASTGTSAYMEINSNNDSKSIISTQQNMENVVDKSTLPSDVIHTEQDNEDFISNKRLSSEAFEENNILKSKNSAVSLNHDTNDIKTDNPKAHMTNLNSGGNVTETSFVTKKFKFENKKSESNPNVTPTNSSSSGSNNYEMKNKKDNKSAEEEDDLPDIVF